MAPIRNGEQVSGLLDGEPLAKTHALRRDIGHRDNSLGVGGIDQAVLARFVDQLTHARQANIDGRAAQAGIDHLRAVLLEELPADRLAGACGKREKIVEGFRVGTPRVS